MQMNKMALIVPMIFATTMAFAQNSDSIDRVTSIFLKVDKEAAFPGGEQAWRQFLASNLNPNVPVDNGAPVGKYTVFIQFVVDTSGTVSDIKPLTSNGYGMEREVLQLLKKSGKWVPAMQFNQKVRAFRKQPVTFMVTQEGFTINSKVPYTLFTGIDNELTIDADKVKNENLDVTISQGSITRTTGGKFIAKVTKPGRVIINVSGKKNKNIAMVSFEVVAQDGKQ